ncbi:MAG: GPR endopeptidase, partial [Intestinibacter sp.]
MISIRTDLALEARELCEGESDHLEGIVVNTKNLTDCTVTTVEVTNETGSKIINKEIGKYITLESDLMKFDDDESREKVINYLKDELINIFGLDKSKKTLIIGLGNWNITSDA